MILIILVHFASSAKINIKTMSSSRKTSLTKNSPIYYIATNLINRPSASSVSHSPSMIMSVPSYHHSNTVKSQFYKLPIQFLSNAKPIEVIKGNVFCFFPFHLSSFIFHLSSSIFLPYFSTQVTTKYIKNDFYFLGIHKIPTKKVTGFKKHSSMSNLIYIPVTYLSNAKPFKVFINPFGRR